MSKSEKSFEENLEALTKVVKSLEQSDLTLSEALSAFEEGIGLYKACSDVLSQADEKIKLLVESHDLGIMQEVDFEE